MEELLKRLQEKVGLSADDAQKTVSTTMDFIREKLPAGLGDKLEDLISGKLNLGSLFGDSQPSESSNPLDKLKDMF